MNVRKYDSQWIFALRCHNDGVKRFAVCLYFVYSLFKGDYVLFI